MRNIARYVGQAELSPAIQGTARQARPMPPPAYPIALGEFRLEADQPLWFGESEELMDNDALWVGGSRNAVPLWQRGCLYELHH